MILRRTSILVAALAFAGPALAEDLPPLVVTNTTVGTNVAAGIGNSAGQQLLTRQSGQPVVSLDFSGRGPMVTTNVAVGTNVGAGLGNLAGQRFGAPQR
jgi:hypothetical protein